MDRDIEFAFDLDIALEAARRWRNQKETMRSKERAAAKGQYDAVDSKERLAKRANRLLRSLRDAMPETYVADEGLRTIMEQPPVEAEDIDNVDHGAHYRANQGPAGDPLFRLRQEGQPIRVQDWSPGWAAGGSAMARASWSHRPCS